jgi:membrane protein implicated in regulation of membrane protease activity
LNFLLSFLPTDIFAWIALAIAGVLVVALWLMPRVETEWRVFGTFTVATVMAVGLMYTSWQRAEVRAAAEHQLRLEADKRAAAAESSARVAIEEAATRYTDTKVRQEETEKVTRSLDRIEGKVQRNEPVESNAAATAIACSRLRRSGQTGSAQYRRKCG